MTRVLAPAALTLILVGACAAPEAVTAPPVVRSDSPAPTGAVSPTLSGLALIGLDGVRYSVPGLTALYHESANNQWVKFLWVGEVGASIEGSGRVQYLPDQGTILADGVLVANMPGDGKVRIDLAQLEGLPGSPFVQIGPGGGCIQLEGTLVSQGNAGVPVDVLLEFTAQYVQD